MTLEREVERTAGDDFPCFMKSEAQSEQCALCHILTGHRRHSVLSRLEWM